jgi:shikimate 5-dehydrogenase
MHLRKLEVPCVHPDHDMCKQIQTIAAYKLSSTHAGGSSGIGRAVALGLSDNGAIVTVLARRKDRLDAVVKELPQVITRCFGQQKVLLTVDCGL